MVDRDDRRLPVEIVDRVAALAHHLGHQAIGLRDGAGRIVDERRLNLFPLLLIALTGTLR